MKPQIAAALIALTATAAQGEKLTPERVYANPDLSGPRARGVKLAPDGSLVTYLKAKADNQRVTDLWAASTKGGAPHLLVDGGALIPKGRILSEAEKARRERQGIQTSGVVDYDWDEQGRFILVPVEGDVWLWERASAKVRQLTATPSDEIDAKVSPKGGFVSFVRDDNLYVMPSAGGAERALTSDGNELRSWATAEFIAQEELDRETGYWWSPDDSRIALAHVDQSGVDIVPRADITATGATIVSQRYPRAGRPNAAVDLYIADIATGARTKADLGTNADIYLARVDWAKDGRTLYVQRLSRDQKRLDLLSVDPATGASKVILSQTSPHWVELSHDFTALKGGGFLWSSEESGNRHLYRYAADGSGAEPLTHGDWPVHGLLGINEKAGTAIFDASKDSPIERRIYRVSYTAPAEPVALTPGGGWVEGTVSSTGGFVGTWSRFDTPAQTALYDASGKRLRFIEQNALNASHPYWPYARRFPAPTFGSIPAADGQKLWWKMRTPPGFEPAKKYPVIVQVYGGPASALVNQGWASPADQLFLEAGYILFSIDNRGTPNRSVAFKTALDRRFGTVEVEDQLAGAKFLTDQPFVDPARIGVTGWSNGGYMTLLLLTAPNSPFAAGVAGAPVTDWSLYDTAYTERYIGTPQDNAAGYAGGEVLSRLERLKPGTLMLLHGMADDNVTYDNSTRVMAALQSKAIAFETMPYPGLRHRAGWTQMDYLHRIRTTLDYFGRKLSPVPAPESGAAAAR